MDANIEGRFRDNIERVRNIVRLYSEATASTPGRPGVSHGDILRGAVVLLHARVEDLVRGIVEARLPGLGTPEILAQIPLVGAGNARKTTFTLAELSAYRGMTVAEVLRRSVAAYLERTSYSHPGDIKKQFELIGIEPRLVDPHSSVLATLMTRRHFIAHRADRKDAGERRPHQVRSISKREVEKWTNAVERFGSSVLKNL